MSREGFACVYVCFKMRDNKGCVFGDGNDPVEKDKLMMQQWEEIWSLGRQMDVKYSADLREKAENMDRGSSGKLID